MNKIDYARFKRLLLKNFKNMRIQIKVQGIINTKMIIDNARIVINENKLYTSDEKHYFSIDLVNIKKIILNEKYRIKLVYDEFTIILEV